MHSLELFRGLDCRLMMCIWVCIFVCISVCICVCICIFISIFLNLFNAFTGAFSRSWLPSVDAYLQRISFVIARPFYLIYIQQIGLLLLKNSLFFSCYYEFTLLEMLVHLNMIYYQRRGFQYSNVCQQQQEISCIHRDFCSDCHHCYYHICHWR